MGLSSNIIWHQTDFKGLKAILTERQFKCSYSLEDIHWKSSHLELAFPMISFCDIPLSDMDDYLGKYGKYTIGMKRSWGKKHGFTPVWYQNHQSNSLCELAAFHNDLEENQYNEQTKQIWNVLSCVKNYEGRLKKYEFERYRFYDEREIRFVPSLIEIESMGIKPILSSVDYENYKTQHKGLSLVNEIALPFELNDIDYILVSALNQKNNVRKLLGKASQNVIILSHQQVKEDIIGLWHNRK